MKISFYFSFSSNAAQMKDYILPLLTFLCPANENAVQSIFLVDQVDFSVTCSPVKFIGRVNNL